ncbi:MAG: hypothetical protein AAFQ45_02840 [Pseudomonadota bacterium]
MTTSRHAGRRLMTVSPIPHLPQECLRAEMLLRVLLFSWRYILFDLIGTARQLKSRSA